MTGFDAIVEAKIAEAQRDGAFDGLPGAGKPLALDDDRLVPEDLRMAYRILKNAGFVPPEVEERKEAAAPAQARRGGRRRGRRAAARRSRGSRCWRRGSKRAASAMPRALDYEGKLAARFARGE